MTGPGHGQLRLMLLCWDSKWTGRTGYGGGILRRRDQVFLLRLFSLYDIVGFKSSEIKFGTFFYIRKNYNLALKLPIVLRIAPQTTNAWTLAP
jgi:hypothetical protein